MNCRIAILVLALIFPACALAQSETQTEPKKPPRRPAPRIKVGTFELSQKAAPLTAGTTVGATRNIAAVSMAPLAPRLGKTYSLTPRLYWRMPAFLNRVTVRVFDAQMNRFDWQVTGNEFQIPASELTLEPGSTYGWQLESPVGHLSERHEFVVIGGAEREEVEQQLAQIGPPDTPERRRARAHLFAELGLWYDAIEVYTSLIQEFPNQIEYYQERAQVLAQLPATQPESERDLQKVRTLVEAVPPQ